MSKIVFVLGAGASAHSGTPLMGNFLEVAEGLWRRGEATVIEEHCKRVFEAIGYLQGIHSKAKLDTYNIETVYAAFEMGRLLGSLPGLSEMSKMSGMDSERLSEELISSIRKVIAHTLERTTRLSDDRGGEIAAPRYYFGFSDIIRKLLEDKKDCSMITFNYDLGLDYSLNKRRIRLDYCVNEHKPEGIVVPYLKLHGSINWGKCGKCHKITPLEIFQSTERRAGADYSTIPVISKLKGNKCKACGESLEDDPFIVPPTWNKTSYHKQIELVWKRAALELNDAENIFVLGYSLPPTDLFFNYLFALGVDMRTILKGFYVYNPDPVVKERFQNLLGSGVADRFRFYPVSFEEVLTSDFVIRGERLNKEQLGELGNIRTIPQILQLS